MEKGSFHTSGPNSLTAQVDEVVQGIPLPNQLPKGLDFTDLPVTLRRSSTLETVLSQNEDLMARLKVSLRTTHELEQRSTVLENELHGIKTRFKVMQEQYSVLIEKERMSARRADQMHETQLNSQLHVEKLEKLYADLYVQHQTQQYRAQHLERYRQRVRRASLNLRQKMRELLRTQTENKKHLTSFEAKISEAKSHVESLREKAEKRDHLFQENIQLENRLVTAERSHNLAVEELRQRMNQLEASVTDLRLQNKELLVENEAKSQQLEALHFELPHLRQTKENLTEQVESLQALWNQKQKDLDHITEKNSSLQKLNQSISITLNQQRKEIHNLKNDVEKERFNAQEKIKALSMELSLLRAQLKDSTENGSPAPSTP